MYHYLLLLFLCSAFLVNESYSATQDDVDKIIKFYTTQPGQSEAFEKLTLLCDTFGARPGGSMHYTLAANWILEQMMHEGLENVHWEDVIVPQWIRGNEHAQLTEPYVKKLNMLGLGGSVGTNGKVLKAPVVVVSSFDQLKQLPLEKTEGKIVVFNQKCNWTEKPVECYMLTAVYRTSGAVEAAKVGAVGMLVRTVGSFSISSPHTGAMSYKQGVAEIPAAAISIEDAALLERLYLREIALEVELYMEADYGPFAKSVNIVGELVGSKFPEQVVLVSGHLDSWDVGQGALDDGAGAIISWQVLSTLKKLGIRPKRTVRFVGWTSEEFGGIGAGQYYLQHVVNASNYSLVMESDLGVFKPRGIQFTGSEAATKIMKELVKYLEPIGAGQLTGGGEGTDISMWIHKSGVPGASLDNFNEKYFWYHHSEGDMIDILNEKDVALSAAAWTTTAYLVADLDELLPRK